MNSRNGNLSQKVNLTKYVQTENGPRYCPAVITSNGRIKQDIVLVGGKEERHPEGAYYLDWRQNGKRIRQSVGKNAVDAQTQCQRKTFELNAASVGVNVVQSAGQNGNGHNSLNERRPLSVAIAEFLEETKLNMKPRSYSAYSTALGYFTESCHKTYLEDIQRVDMLRFAAFLRDDKDQAPRSVYNKFEIVMTFLKSRGIRGIVKKSDWPRYTEEEPEVYEQEELDTLFAACDPQERLWFEFFLMTGMREQEVMHVYWSDANLKANVVKVTHKPELGWTPKAYKERSIPIPAKLVTSLQAAKAAHDKACPLVFPTAGCRPKLNFLDDLKAVAERAGLKSENFWLHKFRATFATWHLWAGVDLRTVQSWLGHSDIESTMRYLKPSRSQATRDKVNATFAGGAQ